MFVRVAAEEEVREGELRRFDVNQRLVTVTRTGEAIRAFDDACPHRRCSLAEDGEVRGNVLTCVCHGSRFDLTSGAVLQGPATQPLAMHAARVEGGSILVEG